MALDTTVGGSAADSYVTQVEFAAYAASIGKTLTGDAAAQEISLRRAGQYLNRSYRPRGSKKTTTQSMMFPTTLSDGAVPQEVKDAQMELALLADAGEDLFQQVERVTQETVKGGPAGVTTEYAVPLRNFDLSPINALMSLWAYSLTSGVVSLEVGRA